MSLTSQSVLCTNLSLSNGYFLGSGMRWNREEQQLDQEICPLESCARMKKLTYNCLNDYYPQNRLHISENLLHLKKT